MLKYWSKPENRARRAKYRRSARTKIDELKLGMGGCVDCGYNKHPAALDFDHRPGEIKLFSISSGTHRKWDAIMAEVAKCDLVCSNCHRIRTFDRQQVDLNEKYLIASPT